MPYAAPAGELCYAGFRLGGELLVLPLQSRVVRYGSQESLTVPGVLQFGQQGRVGCILRT